MLLFSRHLQTGGCWRAGRLLGSQHWHGGTCSRLVSGTPRALKDDDDEDEAPAPGKALRVERLLANLGYGKRKDCQQLVLRGRAVRKDGGKLKVGTKVLPQDLLLDGEELDPAFPVVVMLNKPVGYVVTSPDDERIPDPKVYDLLPFRFGRRRPFLSSVGRLDKATSGLLLLTDDGQLVHRINSPKKGIWKVYEATLAAPLHGKEADAAVKRFASGAMLLQGELDPLLPAKLEMQSETHARVSICEGRYHQIRRMFTAIGHEVISLHRASVGGLSLSGLPSAEWKFLTATEVEAVFSGPTAEDVLAGMTASSSSGSGSSSASTTGAAAARQGEATSSSGSSATPVQRRQRRLQPIVQEEELDSSPLPQGSGLDEGIEGDQEEGLEGDGLGSDQQGPEQRPNGTAVRRVQTDEKWRRRRAALRKMVKTM